MRLDSPKDPYTHYSTTRGWTGAGNPTGADGALFERLLGDTIGPGSTLLDLGFGDGRLLNWVKSQGGKAAGLERQRSLLFGARNAGFDARESIEEFPLQSFDVITAFDVLEHVPIDDLPSLIRSLVGRLKPQGKLIARIPNCQVPAGLAIQFSDHTHCTPLSAASVEWLFAQSGLIAIQVAAAPETIGSESSLGDRIRHGILPLQRFVRTMLLRAIGVPRGVITAHNLIATGIAPQSIVTDS